MLVGRSATVSRQVGEADRLAENHVEVIQMRQREVEAGSVASVRLGQRWRANRLESPNFFSSALVSRHRAKPLRPAGATLGRCPSQGELFSITSCLPSFELMLFCNMSGKFTTAPFSYIALPNLVSTVILPSLADPS